MERELDALWRGGVEQAYIKLRELEQALAREPPGTGDGMGRLLITNFGITRLVHQSQLARLRMEFDRTFMSEVAL